jgi:hypothetical protein
MFGYDRSMRTFATRSPSAPAPAPRFAPVAQPRRDDAPRGHHHFGRLAVFGLVPQPGSDRIHEPLLDQFSQQMGVPRERASAHGGDYESWLLGRPIMPRAIHLTLDMQLPGIPPPDYSQDQQQLGAWEQANLVFSTRQTSLCDHVTNGGVESSFVTDVGFELTQAHFEYFIARHVRENMTDQGSDVSLRLAWRQIHNRITTHAREHFTRYRRVVQSMETVIRQRLASLPTRLNPIRIPQADLETYVAQLQAHLLGRLRFELWQTTCDWENQDYPHLLDGIPGVRGRFVPNCQARPVVPPEPVLPLVVTP